MSPLELLIGRRMQSHLDLVLPSIKPCVITHQTRQKEDHDCHALDQTFTLNDNVFVKNCMSSCHKLLPGVVIAVKDPVS